MREKHEKMSPDQARHFDRTSTANYLAVKAALTCDCEPYEDVFTFARWIAQGLHVQRGQHGHHITTWIPRTRKNEETGQEEVIGKMAHNTVVFCRHQVEANAPRPAVERIDITLPAIADALRAPTAPSLGF